MSELYSLDILRLAADAGATARLESPQVTVERRSPTCGSRVAVDLILGADGRVAAFGHEIRACALGQAAATLVARNIIGTDLAEIEAARDALTAYLSGQGETLPDWPGVDALARARPYPARHPSIRLSIEAAAEAARIAETVERR